MNWKKKLLLTSARVIALTIFFTEDIYRSNLIGRDLYMMMSSHLNIFRVTGPLRGESTSHRWIPLTKASDAEL